MSGLTDEELDTLATTSAGLSDEELAALDKPAAKVGYVEPPPKSQRIAPDNEQSVGDKFLKSLPSWMVSDTVEERGVAGLPSGLLTGDKQIRGLVQGAADPSVGVAQLAAKLVGNESIPAAIKAQEAQYQARRGDPRDSFDWSRMAGNVMSPPSVLAGAALPVAGTVVGRMGQGAGLGAGYGVTAPVHSEDADFWTSKAKDVGIGAVGGAAIPALIGGAARVLSPKTDESVKALQSEGVRTTIGQTLGGWFKNVEDKVTSVPLIGDAISAARRGGVDDFNKAAYKRVLANLDEDLPNDLKPGHDSLKYLHDKVNTAYDDVFKNVKLEGNPVTALPGPGVAPRAPIRPYMDDINALRAKVAHLPKEYVAEFDKIIDDAIIARATPQGNMSGESLNNSIKSLRNKVESLSNRRDGWWPEIRDAVRETGSILMNNLEAQNPAMAGKMRAARSAWHDYAIVRDAAALKGSSTTGVFTPSQLQTSVLATEKKLSGKSAGRGKIAEGRARMQDLANMGQSVLPSAYPDSGTAGRLMVGLAGAGGVGTIAPGVVAGGLAAMVPYAPRWTGLPQAVNKALTARPEIVRKGAGALERVSPFLAPLSQPSE